MSETKEQIDLSEASWELRFGGTLADDGFTIADRLNPGVVCECYPPGIAQADKPLMVARAKLIVAAPKLLKACEESNRFFIAVMEELSERLIDVGTIERFKGFKGIGKRVADAIADTGGAQ
jgi:hypothetical protein